MSVEVKIVVFNRKVLIIRKILLLSLLFYPVFGMILNPEPRSISGISLTTLFFIDVLLNIFYYNLVKRYIIKDTFFFSKDKLSFNQKTYQINKINNIRLKYSGFKGEMFPFAPLGISLFGTKDGAANKLSIITKSNESIQFRILISSEQNALELKTIFDDYREENISAQWVQSRISD